VNLSNPRLPLLDFEADLIETLEAIRENVPANGKPYYGLFSGGKDSVVLKHLAKMAGVPVEWHYNVTTIDPPELIKFIKREHSDVKWERPKHGNFFRRAAEKKGFPTRRARWCCEEYKESTVPKNETLLMGIRAQESPKRAKRWGIVGEYFRTGGKVINPIFKWDASDLWDFIHGEKIPYSELYDEGFKRLGCIGCPMASEAGKLREFSRWPKYEKKWKWIFERTWERRTGTIQRDGRIWFGDAYFKNWQEMWEWWLSNNSLPERIINEPL
jgi:phosphoadenosine phosphosulfate reductase